MPSWTKAADCKSAGLTFGGSNPSSPKIFNLIYLYCGVLGYSLIGRAADFDSVSGGSNPSTLTFCKVVFFTERSKYFNHYTAGAHSFNWQNGGLLIRDFGFKSQCAHPGVMFMARNMRAGETAGMSARVVL